MAKPSKTAGSMRGLKIRFDTISQDRSTDERLLLLYALRKTSTLGCSLNETLETAVVKTTRTIGRFIRVTTDSHRLLEPGEILRNRNDAAARNSSREEPSTDDALVRGSDNLLLPYRVQGRLNKDFPGQDTAGVSTWRQLKQFAMSVNDAVMSPARIRIMQLEDARRVQRHRVAPETMKRRLGPQQNNHTLMPKIADESPHPFYNDEADGCRRCARCHREMPEEGDEATRNTCPACGLHTTEARVKHPRLFPGMHKLQAEEALRASEVKAEKSLRAIEQAEVYDETHKEEDGDLPARYRQLTSHLQSGSADFNRRLATYLANQVTMRNAVEQTTNDDSQQQLGPHGVSNAQPGQIMSQLPVSKMQVIPHTMLPESNLPNPKAKLARRWGQSTNEQRVKRKRVDVSFWT